MHRKKELMRKNPSCFFCEKYYLKLARHYEQVHSDEDEVKLALKFPLKSKERKQRFAKLWKMGNFNHNMQVLENKEGELKVDRRRTGTVNPPALFAMHELQCFFLEHELCRHAILCMHDEKGKKPSTRQMQHVVQILLALSKSRQQHTASYWEGVLPIMTPDDVTAVVKTDPTILSVDSQMAENRGKEKQSNSRKKCDYWHELY